MYKDLIKDKEIHSLQTPKTFVPSPTSDDYANGFIQRYFCQKANDDNGFVYELDENESYRKILILKPEFIGVFMSDMKNIMSYGNSSETIDKKTKKVYNSKIAGI